MARIRTIKPEFPHSESMGRVSRDARLCFILLWTIADDSGRTRGSSRMLASLLFPYDDDAPKRIDGWLTELEEERCLIRYTHGTHSYIQICNWLSHQRIDRPSASKIPAFANVREDSTNHREDSSGDLRTKEGTKEGTRTKDIGATSRTMHVNGKHGYSPEFEEFWSSYPTVRKTAKAKAWEAWRKAIRIAQPVDLIAAAREYAASPVGSGEFSKQPATWLNGGCWDDDRESWQRLPSDRKETASQELDRLLREGKI